MPRTILHADMDAFFASVEQRDNPELRGRPLVVGGPAHRGVVAAASYEARPYGVHSAMPTAQALRLCPELTVLPPRHQHYATVSEQIFAIFRSFTPLVEPLSLDEAFLDISGTERLFGDGPRVAKAVKARVREQLNLVVSLGVAPNKLVAKIASDLGKPDGLVVVAPAEVGRFLAPLPVGRLMGVGRVTEARLRAQGVTTVGQLAAMPQALLGSWLGDHGRQLWTQAQGDDPREVIVDHDPESIGQEDTYSEDLEDLEELGRRVQAQADRVARRLRQQGLQARTIMLKIKTADFKLRTRRKTLPRATSDGQLIGKVARELLRGLLRGDAAGAGALRGALGPVRLTGVTAAGLVADEPQQLSLEQVTDDGGERLGRALDTIASRFGEAALIRGSALPPGAASSGTGEKKRVRRKRADEDLEGNDDGASSAEN